jgi:Transposase IS116/IS110/IS902 family
MSLTGTKRMEGRVTASQIASASAASFLLRLSRVEEERGGALKCAPFSLPAHQTGRAVFPHPAFRLASSRLSKLLATVPGVGVMGASAIAATVSDPGLFRSGREFAAWLGMTPRQNSSGGKERLGRTSKRGDKYIRCLLVAGAVAILRHACNRTTKDAEWVRALLARRPAKVVAVALASKTARIVWAVMARGDAYRAKEIVGQAT